MISRIAGLIGLAAVVTVPAAGQNSSALVLRNVHVIDVSAGVVLRDRAVFISRGRVDSVAAPPRSVPRSVRVVDGQGAFVIPGLIDAHTHVNAVEGGGTAGESVTRGFTYFAGLSLAWGVTTARVPAGQLAPLRALRDSVARGLLSGPRLLVTGGKLGEAAVVAGAPFPVRTAADVSTSITMLKSAGADMLKLGWDLPSDFQRQAVREARAAGLPVVTHVPLLAIDAANGFQSLEHLFNLPLFVSSDEAWLRKTQIRWTFPWFWEASLVKAGFKPPFPATEERALMTYSRARADSLGRAVAAAGTALVPTLSLHARMLLDALPEERAVRERFLLKPDGPTRTPERLAVARVLLKRYQQLVTDVRRAGVPLLPGSDAPTLNIPGLALHDELALLVGTGMTPAEVLRAATLDMGRFVGDSSLGRVAPGAYADLVLLDGNPLEHIESTRRIRGVIRAGVWLDRAALDRMLDQSADVVAAHRAARIGR